MLSEALSIIDNLNGLIMMVWLMLWWCGGKLIESTAGSWGSWRLGFLRWGPLGEDRRLPCRLAEFPYLGMFPFMSVIHSHNTMTRPPTWRPHSTAICNVAFIRLTHHTRPLEKEAIQKVDQVRLETWYSRLSYHYYNALIDSMPHRNYQNWTPTYFKRRPQGAEGFRRSGCPSYQELWKSSNHGWTLWWKVNSGHFYCQSQ